MRSRSRKWTGHSTRSPTCSAKWMLYERSSALRPRFPSTARPTVKSRLVLGWNQDGLSGEPEFFDARRQRRKKPRRTLRFELPPRRSEIPKFTDAISDSCCWQQVLPIISCRRQLRWWHTGSGCRPARLISREPAPVSSMPSFWAVTGQTLQERPHWLSERTSSHVVVNQSDPATVSLFSDGAGAALCRSFATDVSSGFLSGIRRLGL